MNRLILFTVFVFSFFTSFAQIDSAAIIERNADIFRSYLTTLGNYYVDRINTTLLLHKGIDAINQSLDPYTVFSDEKEIEARNKAWRGYLFSGIGVSLVERDSLATITDVYYKCPAHLAGVRTGDRILAVDSTNVRGMPFGEVVKKIKGESGTTVHITFDRPGVGKINISIIRQEIISKSVNYYGMLNDSAGYIKCSQFLEHSYDSMRYALAELKKNVKFSYLILDLRDNIGGLVQDAVNTVNLFIPKGKLVCDLKSTNYKEDDYNYTTLYDPLDTIVKIIALTSNVTVSAGEIVVGALQDYDRAVIIGQRTYGKGYVQGTKDLVHNTQLYLTCKRYYTPSGRCLQELDYTHKYKDGTVDKLNDSIKKTFFTKNGRKVLSAGGVEPDVRLSRTADLSEIVQLIVNNYVFSDYATMYRNTHDAYPEMETFTLPDNEFNDFLNMATQKLETLSTSAENELKKLEDLFKGNNKKIKHIEEIKKQIQKEKRTEIKQNKDVLKKLLEKEILVRYYNDDAKMFYVFKNDAEVKKALAIFANKYNFILKKTVSP